MISKQALRACAAECIGTFMLVFAGCGAIVINDISGGVIGNTGIALTFGLIVLTVIYTYGDNSGAHINPAVSISFWLAKRFSGRMAVFYVIAQCIGALSAALTLRILFPEHESLGTTQPAHSTIQAFIMEFVLTWWLMTVILGVSQGAKEKGVVAGIVIGSVVALEAMFAGPITGASMNPARSLGPAIVSGHLTHVWIYMSATVLGACAAVYTCRLVNGSQCCADSSGKMI